MKFVRDQITLGELRELPDERFGDMVKVVVDIERGIMAVGEGMHADRRSRLGSSTSLVGW